MATAEEYFTHLLQTYGSFKGASESGPRREVAQRVLEFLQIEAQFVDYATAPEVEDASTTYAPTAEEAEVALD